MAEKVRLIRLTWENDVSFEMETKLDDGEWQTISQIDENGFFANLWEKGVVPLCKEYFDHELSNIGSEMKA